MLRNVYLHGALAEKYGHKFRLDVKHPAEAARALVAQFPGFQNDLCADAWHIIRGDVDSGHCLDANELSFGCGRADIHFIPAAEGAGPTFRVILGVTIAAAAFVFAGPAGGMAASTLFGLTTYGNIALMGIGIALGGVAEMLAPTPKNKGGKGDDASQLFNSLANVDVEGGPVPRLYGTAWTGSVVISGGISSDRISPNGVAQTGAGSTLIDDGSGGGKSGSGSQNSPYDAANTLRSISRVNIIDLITRGPSGGLVDGLKSVTLDGTPIQNSDGSYNFNNIVVETRAGLPSQSPLAGFPDVQSETGVNVKVTQGSPVTRVISDDEATSLRVKIRFPSLINTKKDNGKTSVSFAIDVMPDGGEFTTALEQTIGPDKATSPVELGFLVPLEGGGPWTVRVRRITADSTVDTLQNDIYWSSYTSIIDQRFSYPNSALVGISGNAEDFGNQVPQRNYYWRGLEIKIPSNLDPDTREYTGVWDGTFVTATYDGIAWVLYDLLTNKIGGLGQYIDESLIDKWALYAIGQYFDEFVPDGFGGTEPRATFNGCISSADDAWKVLQSVAAGIRAQPYWAGGTITFAADMPTTYTKPVSQSNVMSEGFSYQGVSQKTRHSAVNVTWYDQTNQGKTEIEVVESGDLIQRIGRKVLELNAVGCISRGQARRIGLWALNTEAQNETISWAASFDQAAFRPGNIVPVNDPAYAGIRRSGRVKALIEDGSPSQVIGVQLDAPVTIGNGGGYAFTIVMPDGSPVTRDITNSDEVTDEILFDAALDEAPLIGAVWALAGGGVSGRPFYITGLKETDGHTFEVSGIIHDPNKYDRIDNGLVLTDDSYTAIPTGALLAPQNISVTESIILLAGSTPAQRASVSWTPANDPRVSAFQVQYQPVDSLWLDGGTSLTTSIDIDNAGSGSIGFRVRGVDSLGRASAWTETRVNLNGLNAPPEDVTNFRVTVSGELATASWNPVSNLNFAYYEIRYSPDTEAAQYGTSSSLLPQVTGTVVQVQALSGTYFIKAVTRQGVPSVNAAFVISTISGVQNYNAVYTQTENPVWPGTKVNTVIDGTGSLRLDFSDDMDDWSDLDAITDIDFGAGGGVTTGSYQIAAPIDLSEVYTSRVSVFLRVDATDDFDTIASWETLADVGSMSSISPDEWAALLEVRISNDDPVSISPTAAWGDWLEFRTSDYSGRGFDFKVLLETFRTGISPRILAMIINIDMPDRNEGDDNVAVAIGGTRISFTPKYKSLKGVGIQTKDFLSGEYWKITSQDETGFTVEAFDASDTAINGRHISYNAVGYGRVTN